MVRSPDIGGILSTRAARGLLPRPAMPTLDASLQHWFDLPHLHDAQRKAIVALERGGDVLVRLPTGYGKSMCFQLPAVRAHAQGRGATLVVSPLVALMDDQVAALRSKGIAAVALHGSLRGDARNEAYRQLDDGPALIYASPERLKSESFRRRVARRGLAYLAVDEAHCISEWGHDFRPEYQTLGALRDGFDIPCIALTATATKHVASEIARSLDLADPEDIHASIARDNLTLSVQLRDGDKDRIQACIDVLKDAGFPTERGRAIVYVATRKRTRAVAQGLRKAGIMADWYHAGRTVGARQTAVARYESGAAKVLVATSAFGMGMDRPDVRVVIHAEAPGSLEAYLQQAGRAGRDGAPGQCVLLYSAKDALTQKRLWGSRPGPGVQDAWWALHEYAVGNRCRQAILGDWFGEQLASCGLCDVCVDPDSVRLATTAWKAVRTEKRTERVEKRKADLAVHLDDNQEQAVVDFVGALKRPVGRRLIALGLRGSKAKAAKKRGIQNNPHFGLLKGIPELAVLSTIDSMLADGRLAKKGKKFPTVWLPNKPVRIKSTGPKKPRRGSKGPLHDALRNYRQRAARKRNWKPYQVFPNATIDAMLAQRPSTLEELGELPGIGPTRLSRFGADLLDILAKPW